MMLLFSLLTPDVVEHYATELLAPDTMEPQCDAIDEMLAKYDAQYQVELALEVIDGVF